MGELFGEQEVGGSNPLAPTMLRLSGYAWQAHDFNDLERVLVEPVLFFIKNRRWDRRLTFNKIEFIFPKVSQVIDLFLGARFNYKLKYATS